MTEILSDFKWPITVILIAVIALLLFRAAIVDLIRRAKALKYGNKAIELAEAQTTVEHQQRPLELPQSPTPQAATFNQMPPPSPIHAPIENEIRAGLAQARLNAGEEKAWLIRSIANLRILYGHEAVYRVLLGSQIQLLLQANAAPVEMAAAREIY